jgi:hypothetical protein
MVAWTGLIISPASRLVALVAPDATSCRARISSAGDERTGDRSGRSGRARDDDP